VSFAPEASSVPVELEAVPDVAAEVFGARLELACDYARLLATLGTQRGLIGPHEAPRLWTRHLLNSAAISVWIPGEAEVVDLGSGAGLPGISLALARPDLRITLVEPMARRTAFLEEVVSALSLDRRFGIVVRRARGEDLAAASTDAVVARAVAPLMKLIPLALPTLRPSGRLIALKGASAEAELAAAAATMRRWPHLRSSIVRVPTGAEVATAVMIELDDALRGSKLSDGGGSPR